MKICFLLTHIPDPRINKRISIAKECGLTEVVCVRRGGQDIWEPSHTDVNHIIFDIDLPSSKHIVKRSIMSQEYKRKALSELDRINPNILYCDGFDSLLIACKYKKNHDVKLIYEVADLREGFIEKSKSIKGRFINRLLERLEIRSFNKLSFLVLTSMKFYDVHYKKLICKDKVIYAPNVPDLRVFKDYKHKESGDFTIGFIGGIRYLKQMKMLVDAAEKVGCKVLFAGAGGTNKDFEDISSFCLDKDFVRLTGKYDYQTQIASLYGSVDCIYAVYDASNPNVRIALPNKLYESVYCKLPIIVANNTYLSEIVGKYGVGISVEHDSLDELCESIKMIMDSKQYSRITVACQEAIEPLVYYNWGERLLLRIKELCLNEKE